MLNYMTNNNAPPGAGTGVGSSLGGSGGGTRSADYAAVLAGPGMGGGSPYGIYAGFDAIPEEVSGVCGVGCVGVADQHHPGSG